MLCNATGLTGNDVGVADIVKQRRLTMIDMTHDSDNRCTAEEIVLVILLFLNGVLYFSADIFCGKAELVSHQIDGLCVQTLVDTYHDTDTHTSTNNFGNRHVHHRCQLRDSNELGQLQYLALCCLLCHLLVQTFLNGIALLTTVFGTLLVLALRGQTGQRLFDLTCYCLFINLQRLLRTVLLIFLATLLLVVVLLVALLVLLVAIRGLVACSLDIHTLLAATDTLTLFALTLLLGSFLLTLLATLLLRFLLGTRALVDARQVNFAQHVHLWSHLGLALQRIDFRGVILAVILSLHLFRLGLFHGSVFNYRLCRSWCFLHYGFFFLNRLLDGSRLFLLFRLGFWLCRSRLLAVQRIQVNLPYRFELGALLQQLLGLRQFLLFFFLFLFLGFLNEDFFSLMLHCLVTFEFGYKSLVLLVGDFGRGLSVFFNLAKILLFQEINCRLKANVQF